jgi:hypothetical protein
VTLMQATVWRFDADQGSGSVVLDSGARLDFGAAVFAASQLRLLRPGQRVRIEVDGDRVTTLTIATLSHPSR